MSGFHDFLVQDVPMLASGVLASVACALVGCFLVLRRLSLMGDAISHAVLPGIVVAFLLAGTLRGMPIFLGAAAAGVLTALLTELIHRIGRVETGAAMGVVFTVFFALGVLMLERTSGGGIHLDAECVLYGAMEHVLWINAPTSASEWFTSAAWAYFPRQVGTLAAVVILNAVLIGIFFKELRIAAFDPGLAASQGVSPAAMHYLLMTMVAITTIAAFEAVGSILVVAMLIVPGVIAHLYVNRLGAMLLLATLAAVIASAGGYAAAAAMNLNAAGMIGVMLGVLLIVACSFSPHGGWLRRRVVSAE